MITKAKQIENIRKLICNLLSNLEIITLECFVFLLIVPIFTYYTLRKNMQNGIDRCSEILCKRNTYFFCNSCVSNLSYGNGGGLFAKFCATLL